MTPLSLVMVVSSPWSAELTDDDLDLRTALGLADRLGGRVDVILPCGAAGPGGLDHAPVHLDRLGARNRLAFLHAARQAVDRAVAAHGPQLLMSSDPLAAIAVECSRARRIRPHLVQIQGEIVTPGPEYGNRVKRQALGLATRSVVRRATGVRVVSENLRTVIEPMTNAPVAVIGSRVDTRTFTPGDPPPGTTAFDAVMVGSLLEVKNHATLLRAWSRVVQRFPRARLLIVGEGPCRPRLQASIRELGLDRRVELRGKVPHRQVASLLRTATCLLHPSWSEGRPRAVLEGMASGLPVVCSDIPGHREIVSAPTGRLVPAGDIVGWTAAITEILDDPAGAAEMGRRGRAHVVAEHDHAVNMDRYADFIRTVARPDRIGATRP